MGKVTREQVVQALDHQKRHGGKLGETFIQLGYVTPADVEAALAAQRGEAPTVPVGPAYWGGLGWGWGYYGAPPMVTSREITYTEGALMIDLIQRSTGKLAFRTIGIDQDVTGADGSEEQIQKTVEKLLKDLP